MAKNIIGNLEIRDDKGEVLDEFMLNDRPRWEFRGQKLSPTLQKLLTRIRVKNMPSDVPSIRLIIHGPDPVSGTRLAFFDGRLAAGDQVELSNGLVATYHVA